MRKLLVAFTPDELIYVERLLEERSQQARDESEDAPVHAAPRAVRNARRLYAGELPGLRVAPRKGLE